MNEEPIPNPEREATRQRSLLLLGVRAVFLLLMISVSLLHLFAQTQVPAGAASWIPWSAPLGVSVALFVTAIVIDLATPRKKLSTISGVFFGLAAGLVATFAMTFLVNLLIETWIGDRPTITEFKPYTDMLKLMLGIALCYLGVTTVLQTQDEFRLVIPYVEFSRQVRGVKPFVLDTSALVDARVVDIAATGLIQSTLVVPKFVIAELQTLADSGDKLKRSRGRRGLDVVARLQRAGTVGVAIDDTPVEGIGVDQKVVELAQRLSARVMTTDLGLARVARIHGVVVVSVHELAAALRPALVPGEQLRMRIVKAGEQAGQGVGYLDDGTMVVAEGGAVHIGSEASLLVTSTLQTAAGRLIFSRVVEGAASENDGAAPAELPTPAADVNQSDAPESPVTPTETPPDPGGSGGVLRSAQSGPFPPKPVGRRPGTPRNPRR